jgi:hypothetical protein
MYSSPAFFSMMSMTRPESDALMRPHALADWVFDLCMSRKDPAHPYPVTTPIGGPVPWVYTPTEVKQPHLGGSLDTLLELSDDLQHCVVLRHTLHLCFTGYEQTTTPLTDRPELSSFMQRLNTHWNFWLHFMEPEPDNLALLLCLLDPHNQPYTPQSGSLPPQAASELPPPGVRPRDWVSQTLGRLKGSPPGSSPASPPISPSSPYVQRTLSPEGAQCLQQLTRSMIALHHHHRLPAHITHESGRQLHEALCAMFI